MEFLAKWLQGNPAVVVVTFLFAVVSFVAGIVGIFLGWKHFYRDYLIKSVALPVWLLSLAVIAFIALALIRTGPEDKVPTALVDIYGKKFGVQQVVVDGFYFHGCQFDGTLLIFEGKAGFSMERCTFTGQRMAFNDHALITFYALQAMYKDQVFKPFVENAMDNIRTGNRPMATPPTDVQ